MGISDRKEREKAELQKLILDSARSLFLEKGFEKTSIRNIADKIEYSPGIIYHYFKDKGAIFHALHSEGFRQMNAQMSVLSVIENPMERLKAMGKIYIKFGLENADMYDLMFIKSAPMEFLESEDAHWDEGMTAFDGLRQTVIQCIEKGHFKGHSPEPLSFMIWSVVHGMVSLQISKRCGVMEELPENVLEEGFKSFNRILDTL